MRRNDANHHMATPNMFIGTRSTDAKYSLLPPRPERRGNNANPKAKVEESARGEDGRLGGGSGGGGEKSTPRPQRRRAGSANASPSSRTKFDDHQSVTSKAPGTTDEGDHVNKASAASVARPCALSLDAWSIPGIGFLRFFSGCGPAAGGNGGGSADDGGVLVNGNAKGAKAAAATGGSGRIVGRVHFHQQIRVVLVPSRGEMKPFRADVWWGEKDYFYFRWVDSK